MKLSDPHFSINDINHVALPGCFDTVDAGMKKEKTKEKPKQQKVVGISSLTC